MSTSAPLFQRIRQNLQPYRDRRLITLLVLGFCSGLPAPLVFSNLTLRLHDAGVSRTDIGLFALAATPYTIKFLWAPLVDHLPLPGLTRRLGRRRSWILFTQLLLIAAICSLALIDPGAHLGLVAAATLMVTTLSATQDIAVDAYRIERLEPERQAAGSAVATLGWHLGGTLVGGAGGLLLADRLGWALAYQLLAATLLMGMAAVLLSREPAGRSAATPHLSNWLYTAIAQPIAEFTRRRGWLLILLFIFTFKLGDAMLGQMSGKFYRELGFDLTTIAEVAKLYGVAAMLAGIAVGGVLAARLGLLKALFVSGLLAAATNLTYSVLATVGPLKWMMAVAVISDNFTGGLVTVTFVAYLSCLCNTGFTATQYALLSALGVLARISVSSGSGYLVDSLGGNWSLFFQLTALLALLGLPLLLILMRRLPTHTSAARAETLAGP